MTKTHGQSTKENYRDDIEKSRKQKTVYKNGEYFDDHSYGASTKMGFYLEEEDGGHNLYFFQKCGPEDINTLKKLLEWRRSGISDEIGHKGGGNKRNIYGFMCNIAHIIKRLDDNYVIRCATKPNGLYDLSTSNIDEEAFRTDSDSSLYITNPEKMKVKDLPRWYSDIYEEIKSESGIDPDYLIKMELTELPEEYKVKGLWNEYLNQIRAKQYDIPIYFKNEALSMEKYDTYDNIDLVGFNDPHKIAEKYVSLYINKQTKLFYMEENNQYINVYCY